MRLVGIDYSMNCPCITLFEGDTFNFDNCKFHFLNSKKSLNDTFGNITGWSYPDKIGVDNTYRFNYISNWAANIIKEFNPDHIAIEGYSMGSRIGMAFDIAENTGFLKCKIHELYVSDKIKANKIIVYPPTMVKKFATGKGNSPKGIIVEKFMEETEKNLHDILCLRSKKYDINPVSDICDSYFITKLLFVDAKSLI